MADDSRKEIIVSVGLDTSEVSQGVDQVKNKLGTINEVDVSKSVRSFKTEIKEAVQQAKAMEDQFGKNSQQFTDAAKKVASLKDRFGEFNQTISSFNPDNKLQALVGIAKGATGAIQGTAGAMAFLGVESDSASQTIAKLQGLMAFSDALNSVDDIKNSFKNFGSVIQSTTVFQKANAVATNLTSGAMRILGVSAEATSFSFKALKTAIAATGIGLLVVGISTLLPMISNWISGTDGAEKAQKRLAAAMEGVNRAFDDQIDQIQFDTQLEEKRLKIAGASETEIAKRRVQGLESEKKSLDDKYEAARNQLDKEIKLGKIKNDEVQKQSDELNKISLEGQKKQREIVLANKDIDVKDADEKRKLDKESSDKAKQNADKNAAEAKARAAKNEVELKAEREKLKDHLAEIQKITDDANRAAIDATLNEKDKSLSDISNHFKEELDKVHQLSKEDQDILKKELDRKVITQDQYNKAVEELNKKSADAEKSLAEEKGQKTLEVEKKFHESIKDFILNATGNEFAQKRASIIKEYDDLRKVADEKEKAVLEKLKQDKLNQTDKEETTAKTLIQTETKSINTKVENKVLDTDSPEERREKLKAINDVNVEVENANFENKIATLAGQQDEIEKATAEHKQRLTDLSDQQAKDELAIDKAKKDAKINNLGIVSNAAETLSEVVGKQTVAGKALGVASATIDTYVGASKALAASPPPFNFIAAGAVIAVGLINVKKILSTKVPAKGGDTVSGGSSAPAISTAPVITASQTSAATNGVSDVRVVNHQDQVVKAFITDRDLKDNEQKSNFLNKLSSI
jgi:hypothetical protein